MPTLSLLLNIAVLLPVCTGLITSALWANDAYGAEHFVGGVIGDCNRLCLVAVGWGCADDRGAFGGAGDLQAFDAVHRGIIWPSGGRQQHRDFGVSSGHAVRHLDADFGLGQSAADPLCRCSEGISLPWERNVPFGSSPDLNDLEIER